MGSPLLVGGRAADSRGKLDSGSYLPLVGFWLVLPFILTPIIRFRFLPHWEEVQSELVPKAIRKRLLARRLVDENPINRKLKEPDK